MHVDERHITTSALQRTTAPLGSRTAAGISRPLVTADALCRLWLLSSLVRMARTRYLLRQRVGVALLFGAPPLTIALYFFGIPMWSCESHTWSSPSGSVTSSVYQMHWPLLVLGVVAAVGFVLVFLRRRETPNA